MKIFAALLMLLPATLVFAQKDEAALPYLEKVSKQLDPGHALEMEFSYIREDLQDESLMEGSGRLLMMGEMYMIDLNDAIIWFDGEKQYSLQAEIGEVYVSKPDPDNQEFMFSDPVRLLRNYEEKFKYRLMEETTFRGQNVDEIQLYPEELGGPYALLKLYFSKADGSLAGIFIRHKKGILYTMILENTGYMDDPGLEFFRFNKADYPDVDVIELIN